MYQLKGRNGTKCFFKKFFFTTVCKHLRKPVCSFFIFFIFMMLQLFAEAERSEQVSSVHFKLALTQKR